MKFLGLFLVIKLKSFGIKALMDYWIDGKPTFKDPLLQQSITPYAKMQYSNSLLTNLCRFVNYSC